MTDKADEGLAVVDSEKVSTPLIQLQSKEHEEFLNVIDQLRLEGVSKYISLPQLIVCGDQSSGKSSVLEAISGLQFPTKENLCTRFATELILRRADEFGVTASIHSDEDRPSAEQERIRRFKSSTVDLAQFATIVKDAENHIGVGTSDHMFSKDILRVEVSGPTQPQLTLVDLPGLYHAEDESQSAEGVEFVESLVLSHLRKQRSVILAVISAQSQIALQKVTTFTRKVDPEGRRTMGIITKPDTLPATSELEQSFLNLALNKNKRVFFRLGWHVLKNREHEERHYSLDQRRDSENRFFERRAWNTLPRSQVGIETLRPRLSTLLKDHILSQLPSLTTEASEALKEAQASLQRLGDARDTVSDQRRYLLHSSEHFSTLVGNSIDGVYFNAVFTDAMEDEGYKKRLRAVVQNRLSDFSDTLEEKGMQRRIVDDDEDIDSNDEIHHSDYVEEVQRRMRRSRGRELPGTFNPLIIGDLFYLQSKPWETIVTECIDTLLEDVQNAIMPIVRDVLDEKSSSGLLEHIINPSIEKIEASLREKTGELLKPQKSGHPITYNQLFTEIVQKAREEHRRKSIKDKLKTFFGQNYGTTSLQKISFNMESLIDALGSETEASMEHFACSEAISCMQAYYTVQKYL